MLQKFFRKMDQNDSLILIVRSSQLVQDLHDYCAYKSIFLQVNGLDLHNEELIFLLRLRRLGLFVMRQSIHILDCFLLCYTWDGTSSFRPTSVSSKYLVITTMTPYSLLISTLSINALIRNSPKPPSRNFDTSVTISISSTGPIRFLISSNRNLIP